MIDASSEEVCPQRTRRGEARDALIRARAAELFLERGYDGVTIDDIVRDVGGSKGSIYNFYGGKDGLFLMVMEETIIELTLPLRQLKLNGLPIEKGLKTFAETLLSILLQARHLAFQRLVITEALRHPQIGASWYRHGPCRTREILKQFLAEQQERGAIRPDADPTRTAILFHDMVIFDLLNRAMMGIDGGPKPQDIKIIVQDAIRVLMTGIADKTERKTGPV